jgi:hypothetical protein
MDWRVLEGASNGFSQGVQNLVRIKQAGIQLKQDQEKFDLDKKLGNLQLKKLEFELDPEVLEAKKKAFGFETKMKEQEFGLNELKIKEAEKRAKGSIGEYVPIINQFSKENPDMDFSLDKDFNITVSTKKKELGFNELRARESALKSATDETGMVDEEKFAKSMRLLSGDRLGSVSTTGYDITSDPIVALGTAKSGVPIAKTKAGTNLVQDPTSKQWVKA